jgi:hypothetical protein
MRACVHVDDDPTVDAGHVCCSDNWAALPKNTFCLRQTVDSAGGGWRWWWSELCVHACEHAIAHTARARARGYARSTRTAAAIVPMLDGARTAPPHAKGIPPTQAQAHKDMCM